MYLEFKITGIVIGKFNKKISIVTQYETIEISYSY